MKSFLEGDIPTAGAMSLLQSPWAIHRDYFTSALNAALSKEAAQPLDPVRDGATVIIPVSGVMTPRGSFGGTSSFALAEFVRSAAQNPKVGTIIMDISSPGGSVYGTEELASAVFDARQVKPVVAVANPMAASAAYWLGSQASAFYASTSADVGSVGVYTMHADLSKVLEDMGVNITLISAGEKKVDGNPFQPLSEGALADIQASVDSAYQQFLGAVARGRGITKADVEQKHGKGALVEASVAANSGMIDGVMTLRDVVMKYSSSRSRLSLMRRRSAVRGMAASL